MAEKKFLCATSDVAPGKKKRMVVDGHAYMVVNVDGHFYVTDDTCTHAQASLTAGVLEGCEIECPLHGARFDVRTGEVKVLPAVLPLKTYKVEVEEGKIFIIL